MRPPVEAGGVAESLQWVEEMLDLAVATGDADLLIAGHTLGSLTVTAILEVA